MTRVLKIAQSSVAFEDPHNCTDAADILCIFSAVFDTLIRRRDGRYVPHLARDWTVSQDARVWQFVLQPDIRFHDGALVDAQAVCANIRRMSRPDKGYTLGAPGVWHQYLGDAELRILGPLVFEIALPEPVADLLDILVQAFILSPACFECAVQEQIIGSGPYAIKEISAHRILALAQQSHFAGDVPHEAVEWQAVPDPQARFELLQSGAVQVANRLGFEWDAAQSTRVPYVAPVAIIYLFNIAKGPLQDPRLRRALNLAIDRAALIDAVVGGAAIPLTGFVSQKHFGAAQDVEAGYDPDLARQLVCEAGYPDGLTLTVSCPTRLPDEAEALTAHLALDLAKIGVALKVTTHADREAYAHSVRKKQIGDMAVFDSSPMSTFRVIHEKLDARIAGSWWQGYENMIVNDCIDAARRTSDFEARAAIYKIAYQELQRDPPWLFLYNPIRTLGLRGDHPNFTLPDDGVLDVTRLPRLY